MIRAKKATQLAENIFQILVKYFIPTIEILVKYCFQILFQ
jgi:hypothetical protein